MYSLIKACNFVVASLGFSIYDIVSSANTESYLFFPIRILFISFSSLIAVARTSKTMLNDRGENGHPCLVPALRGNAFSSFSPLKIMFAVGLSYTILFVCCWILFTSILLRIFASMFMSDTGL